MTLGKVTLVGAGPGDPELITVRGANALREADVVLFDELACDDLLAIAPATAVTINVGKRGHHSPTRSQEDINRLLVESAQAGKRVVRLKGGDPFVFGRGGEEASACAAAGIPFQVVPGVSSAVAALAYAGIPVTDRRHSASFAVVTGHKDPSRAAEATRWAELGRAVDTLVILMGMRNLEQLTQRIVEGGRDASTPAAAVMHGTLGLQRTVVSTLGALAADVQREGLRAPSAVVIGDVVGLREALAWWEKSPLFGLRVLVTRARSQAGDMLHALRSFGAEPVVAPMIRLEPPTAPAELAALDAALAGLEDEAYDAIVFASGNAVRFTVARARECGIDLGGINARVVCGGPLTARAALDAGLPVHLVPPASAGAGDAHALLGEIEKHLTPRGLRFLVPRSQIGRDVLREGLEAAGAQVETVTAYQTLPPVDTDLALGQQLRAGALPVLSFTSPSTVRHLIEPLDAASRAALGDTLIAAVGPTTAAALEAVGLPADVVPKVPGGLALVEALVDYARANPSRIAELRERQVEGLQSLNESSASTAPGARPTGA